MTTRQHIGPRPRDGRALCGRIWRQMRDSTPACTFCARQVVKDEADARRWDATRDYWLDLEAIAAADPVLAVVAAPVLARWRAHFAP